MLHHPSVPSDSPHNPGPQTPHTNLQQTVSINIERRVVPKDVQRQTPLPLVNDECDVVVGEVLLLGADKPHLVRRGQLRPEELHVGALVLQHVHSEAEPLCIIRTGPSPVTPHTPHTRQFNCANLVCLL
jgi:hypothetical protein